MAVIPYEEKKYTQSGAVTQAHNALQTHQSRKPAGYTSQWQQKQNTLLGKLEDRPAFSYDARTDALYRQAVDSYVRQGQQAMRDTMGRAAALTGGYGNSYAQTAGQQVYGSYLQGLNEQLPQYYQLALDRYRMEGDDLLDRYALYADREEQAYGAYLDTVDRYYDELDRLRGIYDTERQQDYARFADDRDFAYGTYRDQEEARYQQEQDAKAWEQWLREMEYRQERDKIADSQWQAEFDEDKRRYEQALAAQQQKTAAKAARGSTGKPKTEDGDQPETQPAAAPRTTGNPLAERQLERKTIERQIAAAEAYGLISTAQGDRLRFQYL